jgi:hypothetical protein
MPVELSVRLIPEPFITEPFITKPFITLESPHICYQMSFSDVAHASDILGTRVDKTRRDVCRVLRGRYALGND